MRSLVHLAGEHFLPLLVKINIGIHPRYGIRPIPCRPRSRFRRFCAAACRWRMGLPARCCCRRCRHGRCMRSLVHLAGEHFLPLLVKINIGIHKQIHSLAGILCHEKSIASSAAATGAASGRSPYRKASLFELTILDEAMVTIGDNVFIGPNVSIYTACHPVDPEQRRLGVQWAGSAVAPQKLNHTVLTTRHGPPTASERGGMLRLTTEPAPMGAVPLRLWLQYKHRREFLRQFRAYHSRRGHGYNR